MGQANDLGAGIAETPVYTVTVGTISLSDCDFAIPNGNGIGTLAIGDGELLVHMQIDRIQKFTPGPDLSLGRRGGRCLEKQAETKACCSQTKKTI